MTVLPRPSVELHAWGRVDTHGLQEPEFGVWHDTESHDAKGIRDLEGIVNFWERQDKGYGAHLIIDKDGNTAYCASPMRTTWAVADHNTGAVHVELVGFAKFAPNAWLARRKQLSKLAMWMAWLNQEYNVPLRWGVNHGWAGHRAHSKVYGGSHWDPGFGFPSASVLRLARRYRREGWERT